MAENRASGTQPQNQIHPEIQINQSSQNYPKLKKEAKKIQQSDQQLNHDHEMEPCFKAQDDKIKPSEKTKKKKKHKKKRKKKKNSQRKALQTKTKGGVEENDFWDFGDLDRKNEAGNSEDRIRYLERDKGVGFWNNDDSRI